VRLDGRELAAEWDTGAEAYLGTTQSKPPAKAKKGPRHDRELLLEVTGLGVRFGKVQVLDNMLSLTAAVFDTEMTNARITDPLQPAVQALAGTEKVAAAGITTFSISPICDPGELPGLIDALAR